MIHRHLDYAEGVHPDQLGLGALDDILERGDLGDWAPLARAVAVQPWGVTAERVLSICDAHPMYGTTPLWRAYIGICRARAVGAAGASWPTPPPPLTLAEVRAAAGMSQAAIGDRLGMNQSEVSRLERRRDLRLSTLRSFAEAAGAELHVEISWPAGPRRAAGRATITVPDSSGGAA